MHIRFKIFINSDKGINKQQIGYMILYQSPGVPILMSVLLLKMFHQNNKVMHCYIISSLLVD